jgi:hypothetical protein
MSQEGLLQRMSELITAYLSMNCLLKHVIEGNVRGTGI